MFPPPGDLPDPGIEPTSLVLAGGFSATGPPGKCPGLMLSAAFITRASQMVLVVKNPPADAGNVRLRFNPWVRKIPWRKAWQPTPVFVPGESHRQRSLAVYSLQGHKKLGTTESTQHIAHITV